MSDDFDFISQDNDPAADFLAHESEQLGDLSEELGLTHPPPNVSEPQSLDSTVPQEVATSEFGSRSPIPVKEEPDSVKKWREEQEERIRAKDDEEIKKKDELRDQAQKELQDWYSRYEEQLSKTKAVNREKDSEHVAEVKEIEPGTEWERVTKLCNFNVKTGVKHNKDVSRLKSIMLHLKGKQIEA